MIDSTKIKIEVLQHSIPQLNYALAIEPIHKGLSTDGKIMIHLPDNEKLLLRLFDLAELEQKQLEYEAIKSIEGYGVKCSIALACGKLQDYNIGYMLLTFIEGEDARDELPKLTKAKQYRVGFDTGKELLKLHLFQAPRSISPWYDRKIAAYQACIQEYNKWNLRFNDDAKVMAFIEEHMELMKLQPNVFLHDDIHAGNVIVKKRKFAGLIDFNRYDWGDPVHDFLKMGMFSIELSIPFSIGQVEGYHNSQAPDTSFWELYALYLAMSLFNSIVWVQQAEPEYLHTLLDKIALIIEDHRGFEQVIPKWYKATY